jgi:putative membrane protein
MIHGEDLPTVNAILNASGGLLLVVGYLAIRQRAVRVHKTCMLGALGVFTVFLGFYLYYHFVVKDGSPTPFTGTGWIRPTYFAILITHTILAVIVAPLALITAYLGLHNRLARHVKLARWTLPIWLYVSITGVVVYWMLYRM